MRDGDVGEPHLDGLRSRIAPVEIPYLARLLLTDYACEIRCTESGIDGPDLRPDLTKLRTIRCNRQIANRRKDVTSTDRKTVDPGDNRFGHIADDALELIDGQSDRAAPVVLPIVCALVAAGAKGLVAGAGQNDNADRLVPAGALKCVDELFDRLTTERIVTFRPLIVIRATPFGRSS